MYRDSVVQRRERAALRLHDVIARGTQALALRYGPGERLHAAAHRGCFVASSVETDVAVEPR